jgi:MFS family permease
MGKTMKRALRWLLAWLAAVVVTAMLGSIVQTQFNLARIIALDGPVDLGTRLQTTGFDLVSFAPIFAVIVALALLIAFMVAGALARWVGRGRQPLFMLAGLVAIATALGIMSAMLPVTAIGAARSITGFLALSLTGAAGGWLYAVLLKNLAEREEAKTLRS